MGALQELWPALVWLAYVASAAAVTVDAVLRKRYVQSIIGWVGLAWLAPFLGATAYLLLGVNRIRRAARALEMDDARASSPSISVVPADPPTDRVWWTPALSGLELLAGRVTGQPLSPGNRVTPLENGDVAFPRMLAAIEGAQRSVCLQTYIFDLDEVGSAFCEALARAHRRGVAVRVLIDDVGARYSRPTVMQRLRQSGVPVATFLPTPLPLLYRYANLRNHRKILVVDGATGFTGGMNVRDGHWLARGPRHPVRCLQFEIAGPVVADMLNTFAIDWAFTAKEALEGSSWTTTNEHQGSVLARGIPDGPDEDLGKMPAVLHGALCAAQHSVDIMTPYFLPDDVLLRTLQITALRGVRVNLVLPARSNVRVMDWAMRPQMRELVAHGCQIYLSPPPFDHTKLFVVDGCWSLVGSTNWDARSLRLNFEYNVECYDPSLAQALQRIVQARIAQSVRLESDMLAANPVIRVRDGLARLLSPYL
jgi:cardiolipin synthase A/B